MRAHDDARLPNTVDDALLALRCSAPSAGALRRRSGGPLLGGRPCPALLAAAPLALSVALGCSELTSPPPHRVSVAPAAPSSAPSVPPGGNVAADPAPPAPPPAEQIEASHILVSYQGATRAKPTVTRTREEARALANQLAARAKEPGTDFAQLAKEASDGPSGVEGGALPRFGRQQMVKPFSDAAFALRPGEVSGVIETNFGFHIIKRSP